MKRIVFVISAIVLALVGGCKKPYEYVEPKITEISDWSDGTWAIIKGKVNFLGEKYMFVEIGKEPDLSDAERYEMQQEGDYVFTKSFENMIFGNTYYYRIEAGNPNFSISSEVKHFKLSEATIKYGDGNYYTSWGYKEASSIEWAVMFPSQTLLSFIWASITKVRVRVGAKGSYKLNLYKGGTSSPSSAIYTKDFYASSPGWQEISIYPLAIDGTSSLWISVWTYQAANTHPASTSKGIDVKNSRWVKNKNGYWIDGKEWTSDGTDLCWMIQAYVTTEINGVRGVEVQLPPMPIEQDQEDYPKGYCGNNCE